MIINNSTLVSKAEFNPLNKLDSKIRALTDTQKKVLLVAIDVFSLLMWGLFSSTAVGTIAAAVSVITTGILFCTSELLRLFLDLFIIVADLFLSNKAVNSKPFYIRCLSSNSEKKHVVRTINPSLGQDHRHRVGKR